MSLPYQLLLKCQQNLATVLNHSVVRNKVLSGVAENPFPAAREPIEQFLARTDLDRIARYSAEKALAAITESI